MNQLPEQSARIWGMWCHLSAILSIVISTLLFIPFLGVLVPYTVWRVGRDRHPFIDAQGREVINFQLSMSIYFIIAIILWLFLAFSTCAVTASNTAALTNSLSVVAFLGVAVVALFAIFQGCVCIVAAIRAYRGQSYRYPFVLRFLQ